MCCTEKPLKSLSQAPCSECKGTGKVAFLGLFKYDCPRCPVINDSKEHRRENDEEDTVCRSVHACAAAAEARAAAPCEVKTAVDQGEAAQVSDEEAEDIQDLPRAAFDTRIPCFTMSVDSMISQPEVLRGLHRVDVFGNDAEVALDDTVLVCRDLNSQAMLDRLQEIAFSEEKDMRRSQLYFNVLQQVLDLLVSAVCDVSGGHMWIAVMTEKELRRLRPSLLDDGALIGMLGDATIQDKAFRKRVWFYRSWVQQFDLPVQGGFVVDRTGKLLAAAVNFSNGTSPLTPPEVARYMKEGVIFARSERAGVRVYPSADVLRGQAYTVLDASPSDRTVRLPK